ncbi:MAG TPA: hypothetical protein VFA15_09625, partial [Nitrososphaera sp.]|nr:hypothetical protein [Nitrososphaera sp.]
VASSGHILNASDLSLWVALEKNGTVAWNEDGITFHSGFKSLAYFQGRNDLSDNVPLLKRVAENIVSHLLFLDATGVKKSHGPQWCLIGIPTAGTQLAHEAASLTLQYPSPRTHMCFRTMRSILKTHGKDNMWVGPPDLTRHSYVTVENILSTAKAMLEHFEHLAQDGYPVKKMNHVVFASWGLGGQETLEQNGYEVHILFHMLDVIEALEELGIWPKGRFERMRTRIAIWRKQHGLT